MPRGVYWGPRLRQAVGLSVRQVDMAGRADCYSLTDLVQATPVEALPMDGVVVQFSVLDAEREPELIAVLVSGQNVEDNQYEGDDDDEAFEHT
jgi:hypothetical protein